MDDALKRQKAPGKLMKDPGATALAQDCYPLVLLQRKATPCLVPPLHSTHAASLSPTHTRIEGGFQR